MTGDTEVREQRAVPGAAPGGAGHRFRISAEGRPADPARRRALVTEIAALTRAAYAGSDPLPGLPAPDGAFESSEQVERGLTAGHRLWVARDTGGGAVGALRVVEGPDGVWEIYRVSVLPSWRGRHLADALLNAVDHAAVLRGAERIRLDAVVERCLPPLYQRLGFRAVRAFAAGDKPLTEWCMERLPGEPNARSRALPPTGPGLFVCWFVARGRLLMAVRHAAGVPAALRAAADRLPAGAAPAGVDHLPGAGPDQVSRLTRHVPRDAVRLDEETCAFGLPRALVPFHLLPRSFEPDLLSVVRYAPGRELPTVPPRLPESD